VSTAITCDCARRTYADLKCAFPVILVIDAKLTVRALWYINEPLYHIQQSDVQDPVNGTRRRITLLRDANFSSARCPNHNIIHVSVKYTRNNDIEFARSWALKEKSGGVTIIAYEDLLRHIRP
jgi:hypothetical protein